MSKKRPVKKREPSEAQALMAIHLRELGLKPELEYKFCDTRRFLFDLAIPDIALAVECNGHWRGHHGAGWSEGYEKMNIAQMMGWRVLCFHNRDVLNGKAKEFIAQFMREPNRVAGEDGDA